MQCSHQGESHWLHCWGEQLLGMTDNCPPPSLVRESGKARTAPINSSCLDVCPWTPPCNHQSTRRTTYVARPIIYSTTYRHVLPINEVSAEQAPRRRPGWGFSSVAEASLFRIKRVTGAADIEASNMQAWGEEKGGKKGRKEEEVQWTWWQGVDCLLAWFWLLGMRWIYSCWFSWKSIVSSVSSVESIFT